MKINRKWLIAFSSLCVIILVWGTLYMLILTVKQRMRDYVDMRGEAVQKDNHLNQMSVLLLNNQLQKMEGLIKRGLIFESPTDNYIFQRQANNKAKISYTVLKTSAADKTNVILRDRNSKKIIFQNMIGFQKTTSRGNDMSVAVGREEAIEDVPVGMYDLCAASKNLKTCILVGVGDVYLVAGQSNAVSFAVNHKPWYSETGLVSVNDLYSWPELDFTRFVIPSRERPIVNNICWLYLGDMLARKFNIPVSFINVAMGSTTTAKWVPEKDYLFKRIKMVLSNRSVRAVLWHQGESDYMENIPWRASYDNMKQMITGSRKIAPEIEWFVALNSYNTPKPSNNSGIRKAQKMIIAESLAIEGPDTDIIRQNKAWVEGATSHFAGEGLKKHGELWFGVLSDHLYPK